MQVGILIALILVTTFSLGKSNDLEIVSTETEKRDIDGLYDSPAVQKYCPSSECTSSNGYKPTNPNQCSYLYAYEAWKIQDTTSYSSNTQDYLYGSITSDNCYSSDNGGYAFYFHPSVASAIGSNYWTWTRDSSNKPSGIWQEWGSAYGSPTNARLTGKITANCYGQVAYFDVDIWLTATTSQTNYFPLTCKSGVNKNTYLNNMKYWSIDTTRTSYLTGGGYYSGLKLKIVPITGVPCYKGYGGTMKNTKYGSTGWYYLTPQFDSYWKGTQTLKTSITNACNQRYVDYQLTFSLNLVCPCDCGGSNPVYVPGYCAWSQWAPYSGCSKSCGGGSQTRKRSCSCSGTGGSCSGESSQSQTCNNIPCTVCQWSYWTPWGSCSKSCGSGTSSRNMRCYCSTSSSYGYYADNNYCSGNVPYENQPCNTQSCRTCQWDWTEWSDCTSTCGAGYRSRDQYCKCQDSGSSGYYAGEASYCSGSPSATVTEQCNNGPCTASPATCAWGVWEEWSTCDAACGTGKHSRYRDCYCNYAVADISRCGYTSTSDYYQTESCQSQPCPCTWNTWGQWESCSASCGAGTRKRTRTCPCQYGCTGSNTESQDCTGSACLCSWADWGAWGGCSTTCGSGTKTRSKTCKCPYGTSSTCSGKAPTESAACNLGSCSCQVGPWSPWSSCDKTCGSGYNLRSRSCNCASCPEPIYEVAACNTHPCNEEDLCSWSTWGTWGSCVDSYYYRNRYCECVDYYSGTCSGVSQQRGTCYPTKRALPDEELETENVY